MKETKRTSKIISIVLTFAMLFSLFSVAGTVTASAYDENPYESLVNTTTTVKFNNIDWYVIADNSTTESEGTLTLLASEPFLNKDTYHESSNEYSESNIKNALDSLTANGGSFAAVADMIKSVDLTDVNVSGAKLYLLSKSEVESITNEEILLCTTTALGDLQTNASWWWLRTSGDNNKVWCVDARTNPEGSSRLKANGIDTARNIRPALQLDLSKVTFDAETKTFIMGNEVARVTVDGTSTYYTSFADALEAWVSGSTLTLLADVEITERILIYDTRTIDLNGYGIKRIGNDQVFAIDAADASLTINDGAKTRTDTGDNRPNGVVGGYLTGGNNTDTYGWGGGIYLGSGATLTMNGGTITGNMANGNGGGVVVSGSTFIMTGGTISNNRANNGGGVAVSNGGTFEMSGGTITGNTGGWGAGVYVEGSTFNMTGGTISGNNAYNDGWGGGVFVFTNAVFNVSGTPVICDNYKGTTLSNVHLQMYNGSATINVVSPGLNDGANIGVTMMFSDVFTSSSNTEYNVASYFTDDSAERTVVKNDDGQLLFDGPVYIFDAESSSDPSYKREVDIPTTNGIDNTTKVEALINMESLADDGWAQMQVIYNNWSQNKTVGISSEPGIAKYTLDYSDIDKSRVKLFIQLVGKAKLLALTVTNSDGTTKTYGSWTAPVTYKVVGGTWSDDTTDDITENVQKGSTLASIPTGMKVSEGYTGEGSWDEDPTDATITEAKTYTYTFEAIPTAAVSPSADAGTVTVEETTLYHSYPDYWSFTATAATGYKFVKWTCNYDGSPVTKYENPYRIPKDNMDKVTDLTAVFESDAGANTPYTDFLVTTDANKTKSVNDLAALQVTFNGKPWYIIEDNSTADSDPTVTLFAADTSFGVSAFSDNVSNDYSDSLIKPALWDLTSSGSFKDIDKAIASVYLEDVDSSGKLYLLSTDEASALPANVLKITFSGTSNESYAPWWLRSKANHEGNVAQVYRNGHIDSGYGAAVTEVFGVRPALKLDLNKVKFDSESKTFTLDNSVTIFFSSLPQMKIENQIIDASQADVTILNTYSNTVKAAIAEDGSDGSYTDVPSNGTYRLSGGKYKITEANVNGDTKYFTFTPIYFKAAAVPATVTANDRTYDGTEQPLVNVDNSTLVGGTMYYALGNETEATETATTDVPTATNAGTYYVWYKAAGDNDHGDSQDYSAKVIIGKATPDCAVPDDLTAECGTNVGDIELPEGFAWDTPDEPINNIGDNEFTVTFTPEDTDNYLTIDDITVIVKGTGIHHEEKAPTCDETGTAEYWEDGLGNKFSDENGTNAITDEQIVLDKLGHEWGDPEWTWNGDCTEATATFTCKNESKHTQTETATVTSETTPATTDADGKTVYTAKVTFNGKEYTDEKTVVIPKIVANEYILLNPEDVTWKPGDGVITLLIKRTDGQTAADKLVGVTVGGIPIPSAYYLVNETPDGLAVTFPEEAVVQIPAGEYTVVVNFTDGKVEKKVTIESADVPPTIGGILGDVNGDGQVDSGDALLILRKSVDMEEFDETQNFLGDVNEDGTIDSADALAVLRYSVGHVDYEKIGTPVTKPAE